jgi:hypothetical protein
MLTESIRAELGLDRNAVRIFSEDAGDAMWAGFVGSACETVQRQRGPATPVAPISDIGKSGLKSWLGFQEVWDAQQGGQRFSFRYLSLTVHFGYDGDPVKPQVFRAEWSGIKDWTGAGMSFQSPGAGQPHWQFDLAETLRRPLEQGRGSLNRLSGETDEVEEFPPTRQTPDVLSAVRALTLERMHFASAAHWWRPRDMSQTSEHMNAPSDESGLSRWALQCIAYIRQELVRCEISR